MIPYAVEKLRWETRCVIRALHEHLLFLYGIQQFVDARGSRYNMASMTSFAEKNNNENAFSCSFFRIRLPDLINVICESGGGLKKTKKLSFMGTGDKQSENISFKHLYFTCSSVHVAERSPAMRRICQ